MAAGFDRPAGHRVKTGSGLMAGFIRQATDDSPRDDFRMDEAAHECAEMTALM
jgi:hypothetical protein